jgi:hypothetical protein
VVVLLLLGQTVQQLQVVTVAQAALVTMSALLLAVAHFTRLAVVVAVVKVQAAQVVHRLAVQVHQQQVTVQRQQPTQHQAVVVQPTTEQRPEQAAQAAAA